MSAGRTLLIAAAGTSTRFCQSLGREELKSIYSESPGGTTILGSLLDKGEGLFDSIIVVGGYQFEALRVFLERRGDPRVRLVLNEHYADWGSGWSLHLGLLEAFTDLTCTEVVFAEGDLILDTESLRQVALCPQAVLTANAEPISANSSVAFYLALDGSVHYIYDTTHRALHINEPFTFIGNSGQVWKFNDLARLRAAIAGLSPMALKGTNLVQVDAYFRGLKQNEYRVVYFKEWYNCNTVEDFRRALHVGHL